MEQEVGVNNKDGTFSVGRQLSCRSDLGGCKAAQSLPWVQQLTTPLFKLHCPFWVPRLAGIVEDDQQTSFH